MVRIQALQILSRNMGKTTGRHRCNANTAVGMAMNQNCLLGGLPDVTDF